MESDNNDSKELEIVKRKIKIINSEKKNAMIRIFQWNVLADGLTQSSSNSNFCAVMPKYLDWSYRSKLMLAQMLDSKSDILCLQEVDHFADYLQPKLLEHGYTGFWMAKPKSPCLKYSNNNGPDGIAIFYRNSRFDLKKIHENMLLEEDSNSGQNGLLTLILEDKLLSKSFIISTTHLKAKEGFSHVRLRQTENALKILSNIFADTELPIIWCGDFNGERSESFYEKITSSPLNLYNAYAKLDKTYSTWKIRPTGEVRREIDYIWFDQSSFDILSILLPIENSLVPKTRFPSFNHCSDHIPLCVDICFWV